MLLQVGMLSSAAASGDAESATAVENFVSEVAAVPSNAQVIQNDGACT